MMPELPYFAGQATAAKPPVIRPWASTKLRCTARRALALGIEDPEEVAVEGLGLCGTAAALRMGIGEQRPDGTLRLALGRRPVEAVVRAFSADELARVGGGMAVLALRMVLVLAIDIRVQARQRQQLVAPDAAIQQLLATGFGVEAPASVVGDQGNRKRPGVVAEQGDLRAIDFLEGDLLEDQRLDLERIFAVVVGIP